MPTPVFRRVLKSASSGERLIPALDAALYTMSWNDFTIHIAKPSQRGPDGWFHPSEHPLWSERQLYYYLTQPEKIQRERMDPISWQAVSAGNFWHAFVTHVLDDTGQIAGHDVKVEDLEVRSRGEMDLDLGGEEAGELKSINSRSLRSIPEGSVSDREVIAWLIKDKPRYYAQAQEYLRMSGKKYMRFLFLQTEYPFLKREILVPYDEGAAMNVREKYKRVRQAVADRRPPTDMCEKGGLGSDVCPARAVCGCYGT